MNLPNKLTTFRIFLSIVILLLLMVPWYQFGIVFPTFVLKGRIVIDLKYILAGVLFIIASVTDFFDGNIARKRNLVTDYGKVMDAIADKILVNGVLILLVYQGFISIAIPVIIVLRDTVVDAIKMSSGQKGKVVAASILGKVKTACMMVGIVLTFFYNLPFELIHFAFSNLLLLIATILSVVSGVQYYYNAKDFVFKER